MGEKSGAGDKLHRDPKEDLSFSALYNWVGNETRHRTDSMRYVGVPGWPSTKDKLPLLRASAPGLLSTDNAEP